MKLDFMKVGAVRKLGAPFRSVEVQVSRSDKLARLILENRHTLDMDIAGDDERISAGLVLAAALDAGLIDSTTEHAIRVVEHLTP
jgi:hypothetical protein